MEVPAMAMVLAVLLTRWVAGEEEEEAEEERGSKEQRLRTCPWTLWRCNRASRGWRLLQLVLPLLIAILICMPCLGVAVHGIFTMDGGTLQSSLQFLADGLLVRDQEARPVTCHAVTSEHQNLAAEPIGAFDEENPKGFLQNSELGKLQELLGDDDLVQASCMLRGGFYLQQASVSITPQAEVSTAATVKISSAQEQGVAACLHWGSNSLTLDFLKFLTPVNKQISRESRIFTTSAQFCIIEFQGAVVSPGGRLCIPVAYFVNLTGKAEGRMLLQTNAGWYIMKTSGEGTPLLCPLVGFMSASNSEVWETLYILNSLNESVSIDEIYVWTESISEVSSPDLAKGIEGVLSRRHVFKPESSNPSRLKVNPKPGWFLAPHCSSPVMDLVIMVDNGKQVVGNLFLGIFHHLLQLFKVLVMPFEMECDFLGNGHNRKNLVEMVFVNASTKDKSHNGCIIVFGENLPLVVQVMNMVAVINSIICLSVQDLCSALLVYGASRNLKVDEHRCSETLFKSPEHNFCHKCFDMPSAACNADMVDGVLNRKNVKGPKRFHAQDLDGMHNSLGYHIDFLALAAQRTLRSNGSDFRVNFENLRKIFVLLISVDVAELANFGKLQDNDINMLKKPTFEAFAKWSPFLFNSKSVCAWPRTVIEYNTYAWIPSRVLTIIRALCGSYLRFCMATPEGGSYLRFCMATPEDRHYWFSRDMDSAILYTAHESNLESSHMASCIATYGMGVIDLKICGSECSSVFFCFKKVFVDLLKDFLQESVLQKSFRACCAPKTSILAAFSPPICYQSLPSSRYQKLLMKLSLLIVFSFSVMLVKAIRRERQFVLADYRLQHFCSHTLFFQSVYLKTGCIRSSENLTDLEHAVGGGASSLECQNGQWYGNRFLVVMARIFGSVGSLFRSFFDLHATVLNVRVQISGSPQTVITEQDPSCSMNGLRANHHNFNRKLNSAEKTGNYQKSTIMPVIQRNCCMDSTDVLRVAHFEAGTLPSVSIPTTMCTIEDVSSMQSINDLEKARNKDKKEKAKRRRRKSNISDLKQEPGRTGRSGSSSPPSSPASPANPLANSPSPINPSRKSVRSLEGLTRSSGPSNALSRDCLPRGTLIQNSSEMLSQLDVRADHDHASNPANKGGIHHLYPFVTKASLEPLPSRMATAVKTEFCHKPSVQMDSRKDAPASGNWAEVARRAVVTSSEEDRCQNLSRSSSCFKNSGTRNKPVLLPSATFPQSGRSMEWNLQQLDGRNFALNSPTSSPSLISTSLVAPDARAPGSRPHYNEKLPVNNLLEGAGGRSDVSSNGMSHHSRTHERPKRDTSLYDIWGDHFAEINCRTQADLFSHGSVREHGMMEMTSPAFPNVGSLSATSELRAPDLTRGRADAAVGHSIFIPPAGFSVFSCDAFFSPYQCKDA